MDKEILKTKTLAYIIYEMVLWHMDLVKNYDVDTFHNENDFRLEKILHYPFFIVMAANAQNREHLLKLFDGFSFEETGIIETKLRNHFPVLDPFEVSYCRTSIKEDFQRLTGEISKKAFEKYFLGLETIPIIKASIDQLKRRNIDFVHHDLQTLMFHNRSHNYWQVFNFKRRELGQIETLSLGNLITEKSIYSPDLIRLI